jgi:peptidoglycan/xylan/chitin deacetylase (PgdA/CDA1 family)
VADGRHATVCLSVDFDATSSWFMLGTTGARNLSRGEFGPAIGAPRLLELCTRYGVPSTWYVPGHTADNYPEIVERVAAHGHEVANHGYLHEDFSVLSIDDGRAAIQKGNEALERICGRRPRGIRLSGGDFDGALLEVIAEEGFSYDSSLFGEYYAQWCRAKDTLGADGKITLGRRLDLVELPITFATSDVVHFEISIEPPLPARLPNPRHVEQVWRDQFDYMYDRLEGAYFMLMVHPESIGWGSRMLMLERFVEYCLSRPGTRFTTAEAIADEFRRAEAAASEPWPAAAT